MKSDEVEKILALKDTPIRTTSTLTNELLREQSDTAKVWRAQDAAKLDAAANESHKALKLAYIAALSGAAALVVAVASLALSIWQAAGK